MDTFEAMNGLIRLMLGFVFMSAGGMKIAHLGTNLIDEWGVWISGQPPFNIRILGVVEILAGLALVVPLAAGGPEAMSGAGALVIMALMGGAIALHSSCREFGRLFWNVPLASAALFVLVSLPA